MAEDKRITELRTEEEEKLNEIESSYNEKIAESNSYYEGAAEAYDKWLEEQTAAKNEQTQNSVNRIEQNRERTEESYQKEQSGAYVDWQKQIDQYGVAAEEQAAAGLRNTGYSESSKVSMYNAYQNRVSVARAAFERANIEYDNAINDAWAQNRSELATLAFNTLVAKLDYAASAFQAKNTLLSQMATEKLLVEQAYESKWNYLYAQIQKEEDEAHQSWLANQNAAAAGSKNGSGNGSAVANRIFNEQTHYAPYTYGNSSKHVTTAYWDGYLPQTTVDDGVKYGTFENGYQPKGIEGHGKLKKTGDTYTNKTKTLSGNNITVKQNIWKAEDGTYWYWEGRQMKYIQTSKPE